MSLQKTTIKVFNRGNEKASYIFDHPPTADQVLDLVKDFNLHSLGGLQPGTVLLPGVTYCLMEQDTGVDPEAPKVIWLKFKSTSLPVAVDKDMKVQVLGVARSLFRFGGVWQLAINGVTVWPDANGEALVPVADECTEASPGIITRRFSLDYVIWDGICAFALSLGVRGFLYLVGGIVALCFAPRFFPFFRGFVPKSWGGDETSNATGKGA